LQTLGSAKLSTLTERPRAPVAGAFALWSKYQVALPIATCANVGDVAGKSDGLGLHAVAKCTKEFRCIVQDAVPSVVATILETSSVPKSECTRRPREYMANSNLH